ncbi:MAG: ATP-binding protein [Planctomycetes bacterium]|nr:ATP-binding protein [Planctomycetota bacterium]
MGLPRWAEDLISQYESGATSQFLCYGNANDRLLLPLAGKSELGTLGDFLIKVLMPRFDVVLAYDLGNGLRVEKGIEVFGQWPRIKGSDIPVLPKAPREAVEALTQYFRYCANLATLGSARLQVGCIIRGADLVVPASMGSSSYETSALASQIRDWAADTGHSLVSFLITDNLTDLHPLIVNNPRAAQVKVPLPSAEDLTKALTLMAPAYPLALGAFAKDLAQPAGLLAGATLSSCEALLKTREHLGEALTNDDLVAVKKSLVEKDCNGLIEFIDSKRTLDDLHGQEKLKAWLRQDVALWRAGDVQALPMGYLICGPVGTGKTFMVECLAGEAGVPVVKIKNFRDKWVGSTEGNLEKIFRLIHALGRAFVFIDEADQALGKRESGANDSGIGGRIYGMMAEEMSNPKNRGAIIWILASSRPDLIEVDLKRPGRVDVKIPIFPTTTPEESFRLIRALAKRRGLELADADFAALQPLMPIMVTPGAAEALAVKAYRLVRTAKLSAAEALKECLTGYQNPVPKATMEFQIGLAVDEATDLDFVPASLRSLGKRSLDAVVPHN